MKSGIWGCVALCTFFLLMGSAPTASAEPVAVQIPNVPLEAHRELAPDGSCKGACSSGENPACGGLAATIFVGANGRVHGGPLDGQPYRRVLIGTEDRDVIVGSDGLDLVLSRSGNDFVCGRDGNDFLFGGPGDDQIDGGGGRDRVRGGGGNDVCTPDSEVVFSCELIEPLIQIPTFNYYVDPADPRLMRIDEPNGTTTEYFGERSTTGESIGLTAVRRIDPGGAETWVYLDDEGRPTRILPAGGFTFDFQWTGETQFVLSVVTPNGDGQANVSLDFESLPDLKATESAVLGSPFAGPTRQGNSPELLQIEEGQSAVPGAISAAGSDAVNVSVQRCGAAESNANVAVFVDGNGFSASQVGDGVYRVNLPTQTVDPSSFGAICSSITGVVDSSCVFFDSFPAAAIPAVCAQIAAPFLLTPIPGVDEAVVLAACSAGLTAGKAYCSTFGQSPAPGAPSVSDAICSGVDAAIDWALEPEVTLQARASIPGDGNSFSNAVTVPVSGPFPDLSIDAGGEVDIAEFISAPVDPAPSQGYVATAQIVCAPSGTVVSLSILGTDGYSDSTSCPVSGDDSCSLSVPGAAEGVVDTVTVSILDGPSRQITLVF